MLLQNLVGNKHLRRAITLWAALALAVSIKTAVHGGDHSVYPVFAAGSRHWWADMSLYADYAVVEHIDGYRYSPTFAVAFTPLALLPERLGIITWNLFGIIMLVWALRVLVREVLPGDWPPQREAWFLILTLAGSAVGIWSGQSNAILPAVTALGLAAIMRERWWTACWLLAVPVFVKIWPLAIVLLLMACWPRQLPWRFALVCLALALVPFLTRPPNIVAWQYHEWYVCLTGPLQGRWLGYRDAWTILEHLVSLERCQANLETFRNIYRILQLVTASGVLAWCLWQRRRLRSTGHLLTIVLAMWASWQLLFGPGTEQLTYGIIASSASWAVLVSFAEQKARWLTVTAWAMLAFLSAGDIEKTVLRVFPAGMILLPIGVVLFLVWLVWHERGSVEAVAGQTACDVASPLSLGRGDAAQFLP